jgi:hypothetical protein
VNRIKSIPRGLTTIPVTLLTVGLLLLAGVLTGTLFAPADPTDSTITSLEFGLPAFREGRVWTLFTGAVTFTEPEFYLFVGVLLAVGLGLYERRVGSLRAAVALVVTHSAGIVVPALLLWPFVDSNWTWASMLGGELDAGLSAGGFGVAAAATALLTPPWRGRLRVLVTTFLVVLVLKSGLLWDLEHFTAWLTGLAIGPWLAGPTRRARGARQRTRGRTPGPAEARMLTALIAAGFAASNVVAAHRQLTGEHPGVTTDRRRRLFGDRAGRADLESPGMALAHGPDRPAAVVVAGRHDGRLHRRDGGGRLGGSGAVPPGA